MIIIKIHLACTIFMTGLCWMAQVVHYPLFLEIRQADFQGYQIKNFRTGRIAIPTMILEMITGLYLLCQWPNALWIINLLLFICIGLSTVLYQVPLHLKIGLAPNVSQIKKLIGTNWIRTICWTIRSLMLLVYAF